LTKLYLGAGIFKVQVKRILTAANGKTEKYFRSELFSKITNPVILFAVINRINNRVNRQKYRREIV